jgi:hypothetical protein
MVLIILRLDPTGEFYKIQRSLQTGYQSISTQDLIKEELMQVKKIVEMKFDKLRYAHDMHIGLELLHLFMLDLLGRRSPVAKIFTAKSEQE